MWIRLYRQSMHPVLDIDLQFYAVSFGLLCPGCPAHTGDSKGDQLLLVAGDQLVAAAALVTAQFPQQTVQRLQPQDIADLLLGDTFTRDSDMCLACMCWFSAAATLHALNL